MPNVEKMLVLRCLRVVFGKISIENFIKKYEKGVFFEKVAIKFYGNFQKIWLADLRM